MLHRNLLLPCTFLPVDPLEPPLHSIRETVSTSPSKIVAGRPQTYEFGASESGDEDEPPGLLPPEFETLQMSAPTGDPERLVADQPEQDTNEVMTEDIETPHHDEVTDEPAYLTLKLKTTSLLSRRRNKTIAALHVPDAHQMCCVMISWEILAITLTMPQVFKYQQPNLFLVK